MILKFCTAKKVKVSEFISLKRLWIVHFMHYHLTADQLTGFFQSHFSLMVPGRQLTDWSCSSHFVLFQSKRGKNNSILQESLARICQFLPFDQPFLIFKQFKWSQTMVFINSDKFKWDKNGHHMFDRWGQDKSVSILLQFRAEETKKAD